MRPQPLTLLLRQDIVHPPVAPSPPAIYTDHMMRLSAACMALLAVVLTAGCTAFSSSPDTLQPVQPEDFAAQPRAATVPAATTQTTKNHPAGKSATTSAPAPGTTPEAAPVTDAEVKQVLGQLPKPVITATTKGDTSQVLTVEGMVGQVNGQAIYADQVLDPIGEQLSRLGKSLSPAAFRDEALKPIAATLEEIVFDRLILGEAEHDLSAQEQQGLQHILAERREELIRKWGSGSLIVAEMNLRDKRGKNLDGTLREIRQQLLVQRYLSQKLYPKINVTRKDIERYYRDHPDQFQSKSGRTIRLIRTDDETTARQIEKQLDAGQSFADVAASRFNHYRREQGGLFAQKVVGDDVFSLAPLNQAMLQLKAGAYSPRLKIDNVYYWIYVEQIDIGQSRSLHDAQRDIEELLRRQRFQQLTQRYRQQLFSHGTYNPLDQMTDTVVAIAVARYTQPQ